MPPRSRNFDGCWTCRLRKIKCDTTRPTCLRCQKANLQCKGYDIVLAWADVMTVDKSGGVHFIPTDKPSELVRKNGSLRRNVVLVNFPKGMLYETCEALNRVVSRFDVIDCLALTNPMVIGPFRAFTFPSAQKPHRKHTKKAINEDPATSDKWAPPVNDDSSRSSPKHEFPSQTVETSIFSETDNTYVHYELLDCSKLTILAIKGCKYHFTEQGMFHILYPKFFPNVEPDDWKPSIKVLSSLFSQDEKNNTLLSRELSSTLSYFIECSRQFLRVSYPLCPWTTLLLPFLKQIFYEIIVEEFPESMSWKNHIIKQDADDIPRDLLIRNIKLAILCMCLSISWHIKSLAGKKKKNAVDSFYVNDELKASIELRKFGVNILNFHLDEYSTYCTYQTKDNYDNYLLLAMILQIQIDNLFGVFENFELIYAIGGFMLKRTKDLERHFSPLERHLRHKFNILNIFYESTQAINLFNYSIPEKERKRKYLDLNDNYDLTEDVLDESQEESQNSLYSDSDEEEKGDNVKVKSTTDSKERPSFTVSFSSSGTKDKTDVKNTLVDENNVYKIPQQMHLGNTTTTHPVVPTMEDGTIFVNFGIPKSLVQLIHEVVQLTNHKNVFTTTRAIPRNFPRICAEVEDKILNWNVESYWKLYDNEYNPISNIATKAFTSVFHEGLYHNVACIHQALIVYFKRLISEAPLSAVQDFIANSFSHMEKLIRLNESLAKSSESLTFSPSFWPILVCGCDIDFTTHEHLRQKCQDLWSSDRFKSYNYWRSKQILFEVWQRRQEDGENYSFMDLVREWDIVLSLG